MKILRGSVEFKTEVITDRQLNGKNSFACFRYVAFSYQSGIPRELVLRTLEMVL